MRMRIAPGGVALALSMIGCVAFAQQQPAQPTTPPASEDRMNRLEQRLDELELRAPVDPRADAVAVIPFTRDVDDPLFFHPPADAAAGDVNTGSEIEEAYLFLHDFGVPNLTAKVGRFHLRFGRWNLLHNHDWPTSDNNFATQSFLGTEAITDNGLSLSYVIPPERIGNQY